MLFRKIWLRKLALALFGFTIIAEIVALSPSSLEETKNSSDSIDPKKFLQDSGPTLAPGIPTNRIAEYSVEKFQYVSVQNGEKQWRTVAEAAFLYNPERLVHSRHVTAYLYDPEGKPTIVTGLEAKYFLNQRNLEIFGDVKTTFPDGFEVHSDYLRYLPNDKHVEIPTRYRTSGIGQENAGQRFRFTSQGLDYYMGQAQIRLLEDVTATLEKGDSASADPAGVPDVTTIKSDHCLIFRNENLAKFTMNPRRSLQSRFVHITQPNLFTRSRRADLNYGDFSQVLQYLTAYEDVLIKETGKGNTSLRYATGGRADFDTHRDIIAITEFPQIYQGQDTVTGDTILMHRDTDIVEIEHSNAFSTGTPE